jgi:NarL family two-component system response regulator LiaR
LLSGVRYKNLNNKVLGFGVIRVLIADDHAMVREGTRQLLEQETDLTVVAEAGDGEEAVQLTGDFRPDIAIIDISMPKLNGIEATKQIKALYPSTAILILTAYDDDEFVFSFLEAGAAGYLLKTVRGSELIAAVRALYAGETVLHPTIASKVLKRFVHTIDMPENQETSKLLSEREMQILKLAARGLRSDDIANELCLSLRTVQGHLNRVFGKLNVSSRTEAVVRALKENWITLDDLP